MLDTTSTDGHDLRVPLFALTGLHAGPRLVVIGPDDLIRAVADIFWGLPELATMRGALILRTRGQDPAFDLPDVTLTLDGGPDTARHAYLRILGRLTALGMITGRGVPHRWVA